MSDVVPIVGRGYCYEDLTVGCRFRTHRRTIAESDVANFVNLTWLTEELFAVADDSERAIKGRPVPGALIYSFAEGLLLPTMQDTALAFLNARVSHRFTAVCQFDPPLLRTLFAVDRAHSGVLLGGRARALEESYAALVQRRHDDPGALNELGRVLS